MTPRRSRAVSLITALCSASLAHPDHAAEEVLVVGKADPLPRVSGEFQAPLPDSSALLRKLPGANVNSNGPVTGIAQYRGMYGPRVDVSVDGAHIVSGGPNLMDPPLHYAPSAMLESLSVYRGIAPVSAGQETIGGAVIATTDQGKFGESEAVSVNGRVNAAAQSVNQGLMGYGLIAGGNQHHKLYLSGLSEGGDDARFPDGKIRPSEYRRDRADFGYGWQQGGHELEVAAGRSETGDAGTPALAMDIATVDANLLRGSYRFRNDAWAIEAAAHGNEVDHTMTNFLLRPPPADPGRYRQNDASSRGAGYRLSAEVFGPRANWRIGTDGQWDEHDSDISNPNNAAFFVTNFNASQRRVLGLFAETAYRFGEHWELQAGLRGNRVSMDSGEVGSSMAMMMPGVGILAQRFNAADRQITDDNIDWVVRGNWSPTGHWLVTAAIARKTRSAAYQERYLWLPLEAAGGLADGNNYVGDIALQPEVAHQAELGFDWSDGIARFSPRIFFSYVDDYIQGVPSTDPVVVAVSTMMGNPDPLQFANVDAILYGMDLTWGLELTDNWSLYGLANYVRGERRDIDDNLYRIAAPNTTIGLNYARPRWSASVESVLYSRQQHVSATNSETESAGYALVNLAGQLQLGAGVGLAFGIDNLFNRFYQDHLGGVNRAGNEDLATGERLPGWGRNLYARVQWQF